jgi:hypothetical protein
MAKADKADVTKQLTTSLKHELRHDKQYQKTGKVGDGSSYKKGDKIDTDKYYEDPDELDALAPEIAEDLATEMGSAKVKHISAHDLKKHADKSGRLADIKKHGGSKALSKITKSIKDAAKDLEESRELRYGTPEDEVQEFIDYCNKRKAAKFVWGRLADDWPARRSDASDLVADAMEYKGDTMREDAIDLTKEVGIILDGLIEKYGEDTVREWGTPGPSNNNGSPKYTKLFFEVQKIFHYINQISWHLDEVRYKKDPGLYQVEYEKMMVQFGKFIPNGHDVYESIKDAEPIWYDAGTDKQNTTYRRGLAKKLGNLHKGYEGKWIAPSDKIDEALEVLLVNGYRIW